MTEMITMGYALAAIAAAGVLAAGAAAARMQRRRRSRREREWIAACVALLLREQFGGESGSAPGVPALGRMPRRRRRMILAETMASLVRATSGLDPVPLRRVVKAYRLDRYLLRRAARRRGLSRAYCLALLGTLPLDARAAAGLTRYASSRNRGVRFQTLLARLAADPRPAVRLLADFPGLLSHVECSAVVAMLGRGLLPLAYEPLLGSPNRNLQTLGLCIVRRFGLREAEPTLVALLAEAEAETGAEAVTETQSGACSAGMQCEVLFTLCSLHGRLTRAAVMRSMERLTPAERRSLLRCMVLEGYSARSLGMLLAAAERPYFEALVNSHKRRIVCG